MYNSTHEQMYYRRLHKQTKISRYVSQALATCQTRAFSETRRVSTAQAQRNKLQVSINLHEDQERLFGLQISRDSTKSQRKVQRIKTTYLQRSTRNASSRILRLGFIRRVFQCTMGRLRRFKLQNVIMPFSRPFKLLERLHARQYGVGDTFRKFPALSLINLRCRLC